MKKLYIILILGVGGFMILNAGRTGADETCYGVWEGVVIVVLGGVVYVIWDLVSEGGMIELLMMSKRAERRLREEIGEGNMERLRRLRRREDKVLEEIEKGRERIEEKRKRIMMEEFGMKREEYEVRKVTGYEILVYGMRKIWEGYKGGLSRDKSEVGPRGLRGKLRALSITCTKLKKLMWVVMEVSKIMERVLDMVGLPEREVGILPRGWLEMKREYIKLRKGAVGFVVINIIMIYKRVMEAGGLIIMENKGWMKVIYKMSVGLSISLLLIMVLEMNLGVIEGVLRSVEYRVRGRRGIKSLYSKRGRRVLLGLIIKGVFAIYIIMRIKTRLSLAGV